MSFSIQFRKQGNLLLTLILLFNHMDSLKTSFQSFTFSFYRLLKLSRMFLQKGFKVLATVFSPSFPRKNNVIPTPYLDGLPSPSSDYESVKSTSFKEWSHLLKSFTEDINTLLKIILSLAYSYILIMLEIISIFFIELMYI